MLIDPKQVPQEKHQVVVLGSGVAGLAAALSAKEQGADVIILEKAPPASRGGNTRFAGGGLRSTIPGYSADDFYNDLMKVTHGRANPELARLLARESAATIDWLTGNGVQWAVTDAERQRPDLHGHQGSQHHRAKGFPFEGHRGGGNGLVQMLFATVERKGIPVRYETKGEHLLVDASRRVIGIRALTPEGYRDFLANGVIIATGSYAANPEMRVRYVGRWADDMVVRGTRYNTGDGLRMALEIGAQPVGAWGDFHSAVIDARSRKVECGETNIGPFQFTVMVNREATRFVDEGEDFNLLTYVKFGKAALAQPGGIAYLIFDHKVKAPGLVFGHRADLPPDEAPTLRELAGKLGLDPAALEHTIHEFNAAVQPGEFDPERLDGKCTKGVTPPKSNWALPIDTPPFYAYTVTGGITFSFGGLKADTEARVIDMEGKPIPGLYAAGEIVGDLFYYNYPGGSSLMRGAVFGRIAGRNAASEQRRRIRSAKTTEKGV